MWIVTRVGGHATWKRHELPGVIISFVYMGVSEGSTVFI